MISPFMKKFQIISFVMRVPNLDLILSNLAENKISIFYTHLEDLLQHKTDFAVWIE